jgi:pantetheine-phosphate adenylyltransferase
MIRESLADDSRITVTEFSGLLVDFGRQNDARVVIRGLRAVSDFEYEFQMAQMNRELWPELEVVFMAPSLEWAFLSASLVREIATLGGDVSPFVSEPVLRRMREKLDED